MIFGDGEHVQDLDAESFRDQSHLYAIVSEAEEIVNNALSSLIHAAGLRKDDNERDERPLSSALCVGRTAPLACCCTSCCCPRLTALGMSDRLRYRGLTAFTEAGQSWWEALPLGPTGYGNSPYQSLSSFAGNGLLISPDWLIEDELLRASDCQVRSFPQNEIDYNAVIPFKHGLLVTAWANFSAGRVQICVLPISSSVMTRRTGWRTTRSSGR